MDNVITDRERREKAARERRANLADPQSTRNTVSRWALRVLLVLMLALFLNGKSLVREQRETEAKNTGSDEISRAVSLEAASYAVSNKRAQRGILIVAGVMLVITLSWKSTRAAKRHRAAGTQPD